VKKQKFLKYICATFNNTILLCVCRKNSIDALRLRAKEHQALLEQRLLAAAKTAAQVQAKS
jgi:OAR motif